MTVAKPRLGRHKCQREVLAALDYHIAAIEVLVEPYPLSRRGEVEALRDGRATYQIRHYGLGRRRAPHIRTSPAETTTVLAEHRCEHPLPTEWIAAPKPRPTANRNQEVPF